MAEIVTIGETMAVLSPQRRGRLRNSSLLQLGVGGAESNVAISLARLGVRTAWVSALGRDELGDLVLSTVRGEGVDCSHVVRRDEPTGLYLRDEVAGSVRASYYRAGSAASMLSAEQFDATCLHGAHTLHLSGITLALSPSCCELVHAAATQAKAQSVRVSLDVNYRSRLWSTTQARQAIEALLPLVDLVFVGDDEAHALWGTGDRTLLHRLAEAGPSELVMKQGAEGALALYEGEFTQGSGLPVPVVDTVGAGDAFAAGYLAATTWGLGVAERLRYANAMGAYCVMNAGDFENAPSREELESFLDRRPTLRR